MAAPSMVAKDTGLEQVQKDARADKHVSWARLVLTPPETS
jgi:hypothetical protein